MRGASCMVVAICACVAPPVQAGDPRVEITALLDSSAAAWTRGDLAAFMHDYADDSTLTYIAAGREQSGWQALYDRYAATYFTAGGKPDSLSFTAVAVHPLTPDIAYATARFELHRDDSLTGSGPFTLILQRRGPRWVILHDHSSADVAP